MSLSDILEIERNRRRTMRIVLNTVYDRVKIRIVNHVSVGAKFCVYTIPDFIPGYPLINIDLTMKFLLKKLKSENFIVYQLDSHNVLIYWDPEEIRKLERSLLNKNTNTLDTTQLDNDYLIKSLVNNK